tara:strand:- start:926 stop:1504 length:579 start_codon:yes stop_codon:yes gene_type:complete
VSRSSNLSADQSSSLGDSIDRPNILDDAASQVCLVICLDLDKQIMNPENDPLPAYAGYFRDRVSHLYLATGLGADENESNRHRSHLHRNQSLGLLDSRNLSELANQHLRHFLIVAKIDASREVVFTVHNVSFNDIVERQKRSVDIAFHHRFGLDENECCAHVEDLNGVPAQLTVYHSYAGHVRQDKLHASGV